jgi:hypothetical protein
MGERTGEPGFADAGCCFPLYLTSDFFVYFAECCGGFPGLRAPVEDCGQ